MERHSINSIVDAKNFILGGKATVTLESKATGKWFTFKIRKHKNDATNLYFVSLLQGPNNNTDYGYLGTIFNGDNFRLTSKSRISNEAVSFKAFDWAFKYVMFGSDKLLDKINIFHSGTCGRCGRKLTVPESITTGLGPECAKRK